MNNFYFYYLYKILNKSNIKYKKNDEPLIKAIIEEKNYSNFTSNFINYKKTKEKIEFKNVFKSIINKILFFPFVSIKANYISERTIPTYDNNYDYIFFINQQTKDLLDIKPFIYKLKKKIIIFTLGNNEYTNELKKFFPKIKILNINKLITIKHKFYGFLLFSKYIFNSIKKKNKKNYLIRNFYFYRLCVKQYLYLEIAKKIQTKKIFFDNSSHKLLFQINYKIFNKNCTYYSYIFNGLSLSNDKMSCNYLYKNIDVLFVYGDQDIKALIKIFHFHKIKLPKKIISVGSVRNFYYSKKTINIKNQNRKLNILYIKSNPSLLNKIDIRSLELLLNSLKTINVKNYNLIVKERPSQTEIDSKHPLIVNKKLSLSQIVFNKETKTEELIKKADLVCGTLTTSFMQAIYFNKLILQINSQEIFWNNFNKINLLSCNNENECNEIIKKILNKKKYKKYLYIQNKLKKKLFNLCCNPEKKIMKELEKNSKPFYHSN